MTSSPLDPTLVAAFWDAVTATSGTFITDMMDAGMRGSETPEFAAVAGRLNQIHPDLLLIIGGAGSLRPEIVISAGGNQQAFGAVLAVVDAAPPEVTSRYDVRAFRPRVPNPHDLAITIKGRQVKADDIHWRASQHRRDPSVCDLDVFIPGYIDAFPADSLANRNVAEPVFLLMDHLVGEFAVETQIAEIGWHSDQDAADLPTLADLPAYLDRIAAH